MRVEPKRRNADYEPEKAIDRARLGLVRGGLKAERVQATDPAELGGG
jgi:hypothetical protein